MRRNDGFLVVAWLLSCAGSEAWSIAGRAATRGERSAAGRSARADDDRAAVDALPVQVLREPVMVARGPRAGWICDGSGMRRRCSRGGASGSGSASTSTAGSCRRRTAPADREEVGRLTAAIKAALDRDDCGKPANPGRVTIRRLNRAEYNNTIRDLVGVDFRPADEFPSDDVGYGFDNIGDVLSLPPLLMERYLAAAETISERAIVRAGGRQADGSLARVAPADPLSRAEPRRASIPTRRGRSWSGSPAGPIGGRSHPAEVGPADELRRAGAGGMATASSAGSSSRAGRPGLAALPLPGRARLAARGRRADAARPRRRARSRSASSSWPPGSRISSGAACPTTSCSAWPAEGKLRSPEVLARSGPADARDPKARALVENFAGQWLQIRNLRIDQPRSRAVPRLRRAAPRGDAPGDRALLRRGHARGPEHPRLPRRRLHVSSTSGWRGTTGSAGSRARSSAGSA